MNLRYITHIIPRPFLGIVSPVISEVWRGIEDVVTVGRKRRKEDRIVPMAQVQRAPGSVASEPTTDVMAQRTILGTTIMPPCDTVYAAGFERSERQCQAIPS